MLIKKATEIRWLFSFYLLLSQNSKQYNIAKYLGEQQYEGIQASVNSLTTSLISQNRLPSTAVSNPIRAYSYTLYDNIGRIVEVGEFVTKAKVPTYKVETQIRYNGITADTGFINKGIREQITRTKYDIQAYNVFVNGKIFEQENLRPRISSITYQTRDGVDYDQGSHYSYDVNGNVKSFVQEIQSNNQSPSSNIMNKKFDYDYDLISGKVNFVYYQKGQEDQLIHNYIYDGDNRIKYVYTSVNGINWVKDANYDYYAHGPIARAIIGQNKVETQDYVYTIQSWIKGVKGENFNYALGYNNTDYKSISSTSYGGESVGLKATPVANSSLGKSTGLYNGNIATWATNTPVMLVKNIADMTNQYTYDQLNRIKGSIVLNQGDSYKTAYSYDANGNITDLQRYTGSKDKDNNIITPQLMDNFHYNYEDKKSGYLANTNKLRSVDDAVKGIDPVTNKNRSELSLDDLEDQEVDNYSYDDLGNLNTDKQEEIEKTEWTVFGKVKAVYRRPESSKTNLIFEYDATGNRICKISITKDGTTNKTFYIRDVMGNVISTYEMKPNGLIPVMEQYLYGSARLGALNTNGRFYESNDHLGNVRVITNDFKEVKAAYDYYPFGMNLAKIDNGYRYGFNGQERDIEGNGGGSTTYDYGFRIYNSQIGRFLSVDPMTKAFAYNSTYAFAENSVIAFIEFEGLEKVSKEAFLIGMKKGEEALRKANFPENKEKNKAGSKIIHTNSTNYWTVSGTKEKEGRELTMNEGVAPSAAIQDFVDNPLNYHMDCGVFSEVLRLYGLKEAMGNEEFDRWIADQGGAFTIRTQYSTGNTRVTQHFSSYYDPIAKMVKWCDKLSVDKYGSPNELKKFDLEKSLSTAPIGTRIYMQTTGLDKNHDFFGENIVKGDNGLYYAQGLGEGLMSMDQVKWRLGEIILKEMQKKDPSTKDIKLDQKFVDEHVNVKEILIHDTTVK